jgi:hypothetical protein
VHCDVTVTNRSDAPVDVIPGPEYFSLKELEPKLQALKYKTEHDLTSRVNRGVFWTSVIAGAGAALATETSTVQTQTPSGRSYTTTITTPDYAAQAQFRDLASQAQSIGQSRIAEIQRQYLHRTTLSPNDSINGMVFFNRERKATRKEATVTIAGNQVSFMFPPDGNAPAPIPATLDTYMTQVKEKLGPPVPNAIRTKDAPITLAQWLQSPSDLPPSPVDTGKANTSANKQSHHASLG